MKCPMKKMIGSSMNYVRKMDLFDLALLKTSLITLGILIGLFIPSKSKKCAGLLMGLLFCGTYIPLMSKFFPALQESNHD